LQGKFFGKNSNARTGKNQLISLESRQELKGREENPVPGFSLRRRNRGGIRMDGAAAWAGRSAFPLAVNPGLKYVHGEYLPLYQKFMIRFQRLQDLIQWL
jgi:hypothetical protein